MKVFYIDIVGTCNLRCPSCAVGNFVDSDFIGNKRSIGFMDFEYFKKVLNKIDSENKNEVCLIEIYNWGEPLLHPNVSSFIREVNKYKHFRCGISSNLSHKNIDMERVLKENPFKLRVSLSGFFQDSYSQTHTRGDIELVKNNMSLIRMLLDKHNLKTKISVAYHIYKHNSNQELYLMKQLCDELGFLLTPNWALFYPQEKIERYFSGSINSIDKELIKNLVFSPKEQLQYVSEIDNDSCALQDQTIVNYDGTVGLCCATYDPCNFISSDFLTVSAEELDDIKRDHSTCDECISKRYHSMLCNYAMKHKDRVGNDRVKLPNGWKLSSNRLIKIS